jgi:SAM-dependent methyltransferase
MKKSNFWNKEYKHSTHLALSDEPAEDLIKFTRWLERREGRKSLNVTCAAVDLGCGNGRNLIYLAQNFNMRGLGYDTSGEAIAQAKNLAKDLPLRFMIYDLRKPIPLPDSSVTIALDMMSSHVLRQVERGKLKEEILRVLKPGGYLFFKSFLLDEDKNATRMLREFPGPEEHMYIHPDIGVAEYVWPDEEAVREFYEPHFIVHKIDKSHKHLTKHNEAWKRRTISAYLEKS